MKIADANGYTALHMVCSRNSISTVQIVEKLLAAGSDIDFRNRYGRTALHECVISKNVSALKVLLNSGANRSTKGKPRL